ncbi:carboxypeptidase M32 [Halovivax gelatinilyticus]|uniref:carboxypeptidase M32 n=1 Tax=Halovivax gelatinilyticus TaxID=2961597 RepID=UPI0020CA75D3|nr:carboxypeptidase M32 [Halovivax gelatinilyticus]
MADTSDAYQTFEQHVERMIQVSHASRILDWDQQVTMPEGGTAARSRQLATLSGIEHELLCDDELGTLLDELDGAELDPVRAANVREIRRRHDREVRVPSDLVERTRRARSDAFETWSEAKAADDFATFAPALENLIELRREYAACVAPDRDPYRVLFEEFEPYVEFDRAVEILDTLRKEIPPLIDAIRRSDVSPDDGAFKGSFDPTKQESFVRDVLSDLGYDWDRGRLDTSPHPFQRGSPYDARLTTRFDRTNPLDGLTSAVHEFGHALYVQNLPREHYGSPVGEPRDMVVHESQSRFWENHVGRSRAFWERTLSIVREHFPQLDDLTVERAYRSANVVTPDTPIRVAADELSYHLHIVVRFEIERALVRDELDVSEVPAIWNEKMESYLGCSPESAAEGPLQDVHWSNATFGYFPTYSLGSAAAAQFRSAFEAAVGPVDEVVRDDGFEPVSEWLRENVHRHGKRFRTDDLLIEATGEPLTADPLVNYLREKYGRLYAISG